MKTTQERQISDIMGALRCDPAWELANPDEMHAEALRIAAGKKPLTLPVED